jgi:hypothetical protein
MTTPHVEESPLSTGDARGNVPPPSRERRSHEPQWMPLEDLDGVRFVPSLFELSSAGPAMQEESSVELASHGVTLASLVKHSDPESPAVEAACAQCEIAIVRTHVQLGPLCCVLDAELLPPPDRLTLLLVLPRDLHKLEHRVSSLLPTLVISPASPPLLQHVAPCD